MQWNFLACSVEWFTHRSHWIICFTHAWQDWCSGNACFKFACVGPCASCTWMEKKKKTLCKRWLRYLLREKILRYILLFLSFFSPSGSVIKKPRVGTPILRLAGKYPAKITYKYVGNFKNMMCAERIIKTRISEATRERQSKQTPLRVCWWGLLFDETGHQWLLHFWAWMSHWLSRKRTVNISYPNDTEDSSVEASAPLE